MPSSFRSVFNDREYIVFADTPRSAAWSLARHFGTDLGHFEDRIVPAAGFPFSRTTDIQSGERVGMITPYLEQTLEVSPPEDAKYRIACRRDPKKCELRISRSGDDLMVSVSRGQGVNSVIVSRGDLRPLALAAGEASGMDFDDLLETLEIERECSRERGDRIHDLEQELFKTRAELSGLKKSIQTARRLSREIWGTFNSIPDGEGENHG